MVVRRHNLCDFPDSDLLAETEKAFRIAVTLSDGERVTAWFPKSQYEFDGDTSTLTCEEWLAEEKGLL